MKRTAIYIRVSTDQQAKDGDSVADQVTSLRKYVTDHQDMILQGEYVDDGVSGRKADRDELNRLLDDVRAGMIDVILFTKLDRWFRSVRHYTATQEILDKHGVTWLAIREPIYDTTTPAGRLIVNQMMSIAQFEAENTGQRIRSVMGYKAAQGEVLSGKQPLGYKIENKHLVIDPVTGPAAAAMFEHYLKTNNLSETTRMLADEYGIVKSKQMVKLMLQNPKYKGCYRENPAYCPAIVSPDIWEDVQRRLTINVKKSQKHTYIFSGLIVCESCGKKMVSHRMKYVNRVRPDGTPYAYSFYCCPGRYNKAVASCTNSHTIHEKTLETYIIQHLRPLIEEYIGDYELQQSKVVDQTKKASSIRHKIDRLKELYLNDLISLDEYKRDKEQLTMDLENAMAYVPPAKKDFSKLLRFLDEDLLSRIPDMSHEERRYLWRSIIKEIRFDEGRNITVIFL